MVFLLQMTDKKVLGKGGLHLTDNGTQMATGNFSEYSRILF